MNTDNFAIYLGTLFRGHYVLAQDILKPYQEKEKGQTKSFDRTIVNKVNGIGITDKVLSPTYTENGTSLLSHHRL